MYNFNSENIFRNIFNLKIKNDNNNIYYIFNLNL